MLQEKDDKRREGLIISLDTGYVHVLSKYEDHALRGLMGEVMCSSCEDWVISEYPTFRECGRCNSCCDDRHSGGCGG